MAGKAAATSKPAEDSEAQSVLAALVSLLDDRGVKDAESVANDTAVWLGDTAQYSTVLPDDVTRALMAVGAEARKARAAGEP